MPMCPQTKQQNNFSIHFARENQTKQLFNSNSKEKVNLEASQHPEKEEEMTLRIKLMFDETTFGPVVGGVSNDGNTSWNEIQKSYLSAISCQGCKESEI